MTVSTVLMWYFLEIDENADKEESDDEDREEDEDAEDVSGNESDVDLSEEKLGHSDSEDENEDGTKDSDEELRRAETQTKQTKQPSDVKEGKTLFIRNISFDSSEESLHALFEQFGEIDYCKILEDRRTGHSRGMAFVKYEMVEGAEQCLEEVSKEGSG